MLNFTLWCDTTEKKVAGRPLTLFDARKTDLAAMKAAIGPVVASNYVGPEQVARILDRFGKKQSAEFLRKTLPTTKSIRSGDLGEILATEFIEGHTAYAVPIRRLRWKDHRNMAMRGEDVIGVTQNPTNGRLLFLKAESKSRVKLAVSVIAEAREALDKDNGLPSPHALSFLSQRLLELGNDALADSVDDALLKHGIPPENVTHLIFTVSGNSGETHLTTDLLGYTGTIMQMSAGLRIEEHAPFIKAVYDEAAEHAAVG